MTTIPQPRCREDRQRRFKVRGGGPQTSPAGKRPAITAFFALALLLGLALFTRGASAAQPSAEFVALGSSFAAGPGVGRPDPASPMLCARSLDNYAHLLALRRGLTLDDRSCSGAKTADILSHRQFGLAPQIEAVGGATRLITVTIGGNDVAYLGDLMAASCRNAGGLNCPSSPATTLETRFADLRSAFDALLLSLRARAPNAVIVIVDYVTILPPKGLCPDRAPLSEADMAAGRDRAERLRRVTEAAAKTAGVLLARASDLTAGHDVCSASPWVNGWREPGPSGRALAPYHPNLNAMIAVAEEIDRLLPKGDHWPRP